MLEFSLNFCSSGQPRSQSTFHLFWHQESNLGRGSEVDLQILLFNITLLVFFLTLKLGLGLGLTFPQDNHVSETSLSCPRQGHEKKRDNHGNSPVHITCVVISCIFNILHACLTWFSYTNRHNTNIFLSISDWVICFGKFTVNCSPTSLVASKVL